MYLTIHAAAGALIGNYIDQGLVAFILGFISHLFLDMLPHRDGHIPTKGQTAKSLKKQYFNKIVALIYFDISLAIIAAAAIYTNNTQFLSKSIIFGIIGAILPDILQALRFLRPKNKILINFTKLHNLFHYSPEKEISFILGHVTQILMLIIMVKPLI
jgi:hypothetical protein